MSSNLKVNTILPSTGTAIGIGTAAGNIDILGHIVGHNTPNISGINSVTANHFYGDISNATGAAAGLGTALSQDQSNPLNKLYYTDRILSIGSTVTIDHPASATGAYTQYADILVEDNADLIVADGDDLIPDILGLGGNGTTGAGGAGRLLVDNIVNRSGTGAPTFPNGAVVTGVVTATSFSGTPLSFRNLIINGAMLINQRSSSYTATGEEYLLDRFNHRTGSGFTFDTTTTQSTSAPDGFTKSLKITPDSTQTPTGSHNGMIATLLEADNLSEFASGTSSAKPFALSFYAKSSSQNNNHQYSVQISKVNSGGTYYYQNRSFVVTSSWQRFTIVFPADTSNNITTGNGEGLRILFHLAAGSDDIASAVTSWTSSNGNHAVTGQSNFMDNTSNEFYLTGVQLEVGSTATAFEHRSRADELRRCQRYYYQYYTGTEDGYYFYQYVSSNRMMDIQHPVPMRTDPTPTITYNSGTPTPYHSTELNYKAYNGLSSSDGSVMHTEGAVKFSAEL